jgi:hypothetical protein
LKKCWRKGWCYNCGWLKQKKPRKGQWKQSWKKQGGNSSGSRQPRAARNDGQGADNDGQGADGPNADNDGQGADNDGQGADNDGQGADHDGPNANNDGQVDAGHWNPGGPAVGSNDPPGDDESSLVVEVIDDDGNATSVAVASMQVAYIPVLGDSHVQLLNHWSLQAVLLHCDHMHHNLVH